MAKYYIDTEFIESFHKPLFGKKRHFIDLISIGIKAEDGREYYAISSEYNYKDADKWVQENVILPAYTSVVHGDRRNVYDASNFNKSFGISNNQIAADIIHFIGGEPQNTNGAHSYPEFYGYYADYDWVLFCSLFGRMIDLPSGYPMYCKDLMQILEEKANSKARVDIIKHLSKEDKEDLLWNHMNGVELSNVDLLKRTVNYPKQENDHNALSDAKWNMELHKFIKSL